VHLTRGLPALRRARRGSYRVTGTVYAGGAHASVTGGGSYV
jgi:hypothetical protein